MTPGLDMVEAIVDPLPALLSSVATEGPIAAGDLGSGAHLSICASVLGNPQPEPSHN
jgi:hypothetical protein